MHYWKLGIAAIAVTLLSGCVSLYQYRSEGEITTHDGQQRNAVLYWHKDEGRLWYGKKYEQLETDVTLRICNAIPKPFVLGDAGHVELLSRGSGGEFRLAAVADGELVMLDAEQQIGAGQPCGLILADDQPAGTDGLRREIAPEVAILCEDRARRSRYPRVAIYRFGAIKRAEIDKDARPAPDPCQ